MARIQEMVTSTLRGSELQTRTRNTILDMVGRSPYRSARVTLQWDGDSGDLVIGSETHMVSGRVTFRDGSPSQVSITMDIDNGALRYISGGIERVRRDIREAGSRLSDPSSATSEVAPERTLAERTDAAVSVMDTIAESLRTAGRTLTGENGDPADPAPASDQAPAPDATPPNAKQQAMERWRAGGGVIDVGREDDPWKTGTPWYVWAIGGAVVIGGGFLIYNVVTE